MKASAPALALALALLVAGCGGGGGSHSSTGASRTRSKTQSKTPSQATSTDYAEAHLSFGAAPLSVAQRSTLVKSGKLAIRVRVSRAGKVSGFGQAQINGTILKVAHATPVTARRAGTVDLTLHLTPATRKVLAHGHSVLMYVAVSFSGSRTLQRLTVPLRP